MVNWKSKYLEMKLKYLNAKNLIGGNNHNNNIKILFTGSFFTFPNPDEEYIGVAHDAGVFTFRQFSRLVKRDFLNLEAGFNARNLPNPSEEEIKYLILFESLKQSLKDDNEPFLFGIVDDLRNDPNSAYNIQNNTNMRNNVLQLYGARLIQSE